MTVFHTATDEDGEPEVSNIHINVHRTEHVTVALFSYHLFVFWSLKWWKANGINSLRVKTVLSERKIPKKKPSIA